MTGTPTLESPADVQRDAEALQAAVADLVRVYQFRDRDRICCYDISVTQCYALETLVEHGPLRLGALADRLYLDKSTTSRVVGTLARKGYVEQQAEGGDRRAVALSATRAGKRLYEQITARADRAAEGVARGARSRGARRRRAGHSGPGASGGCAISRGRLGRHRGWLLQLAGRRSFGRMHVVFSFAR